MDVDTEYDILSEYITWIEDSSDGTVDTESQKFLQDLLKEVAGDCFDMFFQWKDLEGGVLYRKNEDGSYTAGSGFELGYE